MYHYVNIRKVFILHLSESSVQDKHKYETTESVKPSQMIVEIESPLITGILESLPSPLSQPQYSKQNWNKKEAISRLSRS